MNKTNSLIKIFTVIFLLIVTSTSNAEIPNLTIFETQWQQSGYPLNARKWAFEQERKLTYSINEEASSGTARVIREALAAVGKEANIEFVPSVNASVNASTSTNAQVTAQLAFQVSRYSETQLQSSSCNAQYFEKNFEITHVRFKISEQQAYRCALHELMHGMGLMGHPSGDTVLSYFEGNRSGLKEIDKFLLKHWNSALITPGMNVFRVTKLLGDQWIEEKVPSDQQDKARQEQAQWFQKTFAEMDAFADGKGEPPRILYRSGRLSEDGLQRSRAAILGILGVAHLEAYGTAPNPERARDLLFRGMKGKAAGARQALLYALGQNKWATTTVSEVCEWIKTTPLAESQLSQSQVDAALASKSCTG